MNSTSAFPPCKRVAALVGRRCASHMRHRREGNPMNGPLLLDRPRFASVLAAIVAFALVVAPASVLAQPPQASLSYLPPGLNAWFVSADGTTVVGVEETTNGTQAFVYRD